MLQKTLPKTLIHTNVIPTADTDTYISRTAANRIWISTVLRVLTDEGKKRNIVELKNRVDTTNDLTLLKISATITKVTKDTISTTVTKETIDTNATVTKSNNRKAGISTVSRENIIKPSIVTEDATKYANATKDANADADTLYRTSTAAISTVSREGITKPCPCCRFKISLNRTCKECI